MSEKKFLDLTGLDYFWTKVKNYITGQLSGKADKVSNPTDGRLLKMNGYGNLADSGKSVSDFVLGTDKGVNNGVASLDSSGKIPTSQLPSDIHDIVEGNSSSNFPGTGTTGRLYVAKDTNKIYRWDGSTYVEVALKLGTTSTTAFAGDKGKAIEDMIPSSASASNKLATASDIPNVTGKADKVSGATSGNFAGLDANGNLTDSGKKPSDYLTHVSSTTDNAVVRFDGTSGNIQNSGVTINDSNHITAVKFIKSSGTSSQFLKADGSVDSSTYLTQHQDITGKADKVSGATNNDFAGLDANGNLKDSGYKASDFAVSAKGIPDGGSTGQILAKKSGSNNDVEWVNQVSGVSDYSDLTGKPSINSHTLSGNQSASALGLQSEIDSSHKLLSDLVDSTNQTNQFVTAQEKTDLATIKSNYLHSGSGEGTSSVQDFDAFSDTVHNKPQVLSTAQQVQARENINAQETLVSGTTIKTINMQNILGSGNIDTVNGYINANSISDLNTNYPAGSIYSSKIALIPSTTTEGSLDYYTCTSNNNTWSWVLAGTTSPIVDVQSVEMFGRMVPLNVENNKSIFGPGNYQDGETTKYNPGHEYTSSTSYAAHQYVITFKVDFESSDYIFYFILNSGATKVCIVNFYTNELDTWVPGTQNDGQFSAFSNQVGSGVGAWIGGFARNTTGATTSVTYDMVTLDSFFDDIEWNTQRDSSTQTKEWFKANCKYVKLLSYDYNDPSSTSYRPAYMYEKFSISSSFMPRSVTPNQIDIYAATIQLPQVWNDKAADSGDATEIQTHNVVSPWGIIWPETYSQLGTPTQVIAMLHGSNGYVKEGRLGYTTGGWIATREKYLAAGFAVMDINGYGVTSGSAADDNSKHWGCPAAIETLDKAFEFLKSNFNVCSKLIIAGTSMGGALAMTYAKTHANKVAAIGLFAPNNFAFSMRYLNNANYSAGTYDGSKELAWGYGKDGYEAAATDNYSHMVGYVPITECQVIDDESGVISKFDWRDYSWNDRLVTLSKQLIDTFPSIPIRVWQGSADTQVYPNFTRQFVNALRRGNANVTLRMCQGVDHNTISSTVFVQNEAVSWFKRFVNN